MIYGTYINPFGKEFEFDIEHGTITHSDMGDDYDSFIEELSLLNNK